MHLETTFRVRLAEREREVRNLIEQNERLAALGTQPAPVVRLWRSLLAGAAERTPARPGGATTPSREPATLRFEPQSHQGRAA